MRWLKAASSCSSSSRTAAARSSRSSAQATSWAGLELRLGRRRRSPDPRAPKPDSIGALRGRLAAPGSALRPSAGATLGAARPRSLLGRKSAQERVTTFIAHLVPGRSGADGTSPQPGADQIRVDLAMSRQEIADYLGLTIETVSRTFSALRRSGVIAYRKQGRG